MAPLHYVEVELSPGQTVSKLGDGGGLNGGGLNGGAAPSSSSISSLGPTRSGVGVVGAATPRAAPPWPWRGPRPPGGGTTSGGGSFGGVHLSPALRRSLWTGSMILSWYVLSTALGMYNKVVVGKDKGVPGRGAFPAPLLMSGVQFAFQALLAKLVFASGAVARAAPPMAPREWARLVLPNGAITGLDIGLSNKSLVHITMSFYTMCKSTTPIFLLLFAFLWRLERPSWGLAGVVGVIVSGLLLLVKGEAKFDATGFALVMTAACMSGLRFTLTQVLLHGRAARASEGGGGSGGGHGGGGHGGGGGGGSGAGGGSSSSSGARPRSPFGGPLEVLEALTPVMSATTLLLSLLTERLWDVLPGSPYFAGLGRSCGTAGVIFAGALIAFAMVWCEYEVIRQTSALTFMVAGVVKEVLTILAAVAVFRDPFGALNAVGLGVTIFGVGLFNIYKLRRLRAAAAEAGGEEVVLVRRGGGAPGNIGGVGGGVGGFGGGKELEDGGGGFALNHGGGGGGGGAGGGGLTARSGSASARNGGGGVAGGGGSGPPGERRRGSGSGGESGDDEGLPLLAVEPPLPSGGLSSPPMRH